MSKDSVPGTNAAIYAESAGVTAQWSPVSRSGAREVWDGGDAQGGASEGQSPARGAPDAVRRSGAVLD